MLASLGTNYEVLFLIPTPFFYSEFVVDTRQRNFLPMYFLVVSTSQD